uniref:FIST domain-containing protein n=1 Tax=Alexandrium monilatum TaxID=311494 RepID=A0A7S4QNZ8_9DINO|mmetsp:Transcript_68363/g.211378  ORF Transcript_68363/g.211378 Transcript_68363/m.211378 type:complete len:408 (+) Transcript_68363:73-1296(+)
MARAPARASHRSRLWLAAGVTGALLARHGCGPGRAFAAAPAARGLVQAPRALPRPADAAAAAAAAGPGSTATNSCRLISACVGVTAGACLIPARRRRRCRTERARRNATSLPGAGGAIETFLVRGPVDVSTLAVRCAPLAAYFDIECVAFFCLRVKPEVVASVAGGSLGLHGVCPVFIAESGGIIGWDKELKANVELMERAEGGEGAEGVVVVAFRGGCHEPTSEREEDRGSSSNLPEGRALHMVVRSSGKPAAPPSGVVYGGVAKACYQLEHSGDLTPVSQFAVSTPFAVLASFSDGAGEAASASLKMLPEVASPPIAAGYFSCPGRGVHKYGEENAEPAAFARHGLEKVRLFGMFADALGPATQAAPIRCVPELTEWTSILDADPRPEVQLHSADSASILALYGK